MPKVELTVTVGTAWTYVGDGEALRLKDTAGGCAVIEIARAIDVWPDYQASAPSQPEEPS